MIVIRYTGGIGNQMYQYALQIVLKNKYPSVPVKVDVSFYNLLNEHTGFEIDKCFFADLEYSTKKEIGKFCCAFIPSMCLKRVPVKIRKWVAFHVGRIEEIKELVLRNKRGHIIAVNESNVYFDLLFHLNTDENWYIKGLWQNWEYFKGYEDIIKMHMKYKRKYSDEEKQISEKIKSTCSVSVHVRRGDFVGSELDICGKEYYKKALKKITQLTLDRTFFFFTDDKLFVEQEFSFIKNKYVISHRKEDAIFDMMLMSECQHNIISNSTFSFWASFLNDNLGKIVIAPKYSYITKKGKYKYSLPDDYIQIEI